MLLRILSGALIRQKRRSFMTALTMALGISLATAMLVVLFGAGDKINRELKSFGANIVVTQKTSSLVGELYDTGDGAGSGTLVPGRYLDEADLPKIKTIFWANNIVDFAPYLESQALVRLAPGQTNPGAAAPEGSFRKIDIRGTWFSRALDLPTGESVTTGISSLKSWWSVEGSWARDGAAGAEPDPAKPAGGHGGHGTHSSGSADGSSAELMVGSKLAGQLGLVPGSVLEILPAEGGAAGAQARRGLVTGVLESGDGEDDVLFAPLGFVQELSGLEGKVGSVEVSAITTPENDLARRAAKNPLALSNKDWDAWYCTAYVGAIAYQIEEVVKDSRAKPVRQVAESEGTILKKTQLLMLLITIVSLAGTALGISNLVSAGVMERGRELGLVKALGASDLRISVQIVLETLILGLVGGIVGYVSGLGLAWTISRSVFGSGIDVSGNVALLVTLLAVLVTLVGSLPAVKALLRLKPAVVLHGR